MYALKVKNIVYYGLVILTPHLVIWGLSVHSPGHRMIYVGWCG